MTCFVGSLASFPALRTHHGLGHRQQSLARQVQISQRYQCDDLANINLGDYIRSLTSYLFNSYGVASHMVKLRINVDSAPLGLDRAIPCGLIINELVSNALKYAFPSGRKGEILVDLLRHGDGRLVLTVKDNGIGLPDGMDVTDTPSLGLQLVNTLVRQLDGTIEVGNSNGTEFRMVLS